MFKTDWKPDRDFIMVEPEMLPEKIGKIIIPDMARETLNEGVILQLCPLCTEHLKVRMRVVFKKNSDFKFDVDGHVVLLVQEVNELCYKTATPAKKMFPSSETHESGVFKQYTQQCPHTNVTTLMARGKGK